MIASFLAAVPGLVSIPWRRAAYTSLNNAGRNEQRQANSRCRAFVRFSLIVLSRQVEIEVDRCAIGNAKQAFAQLVRDAGRSEDLNAPSQNTMPGQRHKACP